MSEWTAFEQIILDGESNPGEIVLLNNRYQVRVNEFESGVTWLSMKRIRKEHIHDWRELLRVKNEICGPDREAIELYPGMFRVVDTSNQYHLFVMPLGIGINLGYIQTHIEDDSPDEFVLDQARQRPLPSWMTPVIPDDRGSTMPVATGGDGEGGLALTFPLVYEDE